MNSARSTSTRLNSCWLPPDQADISKAAKLAKAKLIALIDGPKLTQMIASVQQSGNMDAPPEAVRECPMCGSEMVLRVVKKGAHSGKKFWGCSKFPECRGVVSAGG